jgi:hypothetical protein
MWQIVAASPPYASRPEATGAGNSPSNSNRTSGVVSPLLTLNCPPPMTGFGIDRLTYLDILTSVDAFGNRSSQGSRGGSMVRPLLRTPAIHLR